MTNQEKLKKIEDILREYAGDNTAFNQPEMETEQQKKFREDLHTIVSLLFKKEFDVQPGMTVAQIKERMQAIWKETKPDTWE